MTLQLTGLVAATHSPFTKQGDLLIDSVAKQAEMLLQDQVHFAFITGTTGESSSLTVEERLALTQRGVKSRVAPSSKSSCMSGQIACTMPRPWPLPLKQMARLQLLR